MVYNYTRPLRPVAASEKGPGPSVALPTLTGYTDHDPRSVHTRGPAYHLGLGYGPVPGPVSPGPCYNPDAKVLRAGRSEGRSYSLYSKLPEPAKFTAPPPGTYSTGSTSLIKTRAPAYSFGIVCPQINSYSTPAPNAYTKSSTLGRSVVSDIKQQPAYSIYGRSKTGGFADDLRKTPGPGTYSAVDPDRYKKRRPQYSLTGRTPMPGDSTLKPGPGAHRPEEVLITKQMSPRYTFGIRHSDYEAPLIFNGTE